VYGAVTVRLRVLSWNLMHGRAVPPAARELLDEFAAALARWGWDLALLQEVPPWWPAALAARLDVEQRHVLTSRNALLPLRRALASRWPDLMKSNGGGANAILVRGRAVAEHRVRRLGFLPERRLVHAVRLQDGVWIANLHTEAQAEQGWLAGATLREWAAGAPAILGGDFNIADLHLDGFVHAGGHGVDHVFAAGLQPVGEVEVLDRGSLSDHAPVAVTVS
jgi:endonuclease/exonuclease/phosphatase family metal-dependent hydrolase